MDAFWKWLIQANARAVLLAGVLILFLASGWWVWRLSSPTDSGSVHTPGPAEPPQKVSLGVLAFLDAELSRTNALPRNPFAPAPIVQRPSKVPGIPVPVPVPATNTVSRPLPPKPPTVTPPPPPPKQKETVSITYHGMLRRTDGRILAWVEDSKSGRSAFYATGENAQVIAVGAIRESELDVTLADGTRITLRINEPAVFEEGRYVSP